MIGWQLKVISQRRTLPCNEFHSWQTNHKKTLHLIICLIIINQCIRTSKKHWHWVSDSVRLTSTKTKGMKLNKKSSNWQFWHKVTGVPTFQCLVGMRMIKGSVKDKFFFCSPSVKDQVQSWSSGEAVKGWSHSPTKMQIWFFKIFTFVNPVRDVAKINTHGDSSLL